MNIDSKDTLVGQPILAIRKLLRLGQHRTWGAGLVKEILNTDSESAKRIISALQRQGYIKQRNSVDKHERWENTLKGNALALASAAKPISRATAERNLTQLLARVRKVNEDDYFLYKVQKVVLFGSYLRSTQTLSDLDVAITLAPKEANRERQDLLEKQRIRAAKNEGRVFGNFLVQLFWPQLEVRKFLKSRSRVISLHEPCDGILEQTESRVIYTVE
ncbi:MAG TPA: nucleotidyltransferase domain-containing protein [Pyrinomonadaceae bacterium]|nr:nucleotidyltransferase domain-containing protein [Pyrinomonadaceae bacterium]